MTQNISVFGLVVTLVASKTFPSGTVIDQFADDADPLDIPEIQIADAAMGPNGDLVLWGKPTPIEITLNVVPNSDSDRNLAILFEANRLARGKTSAQDNVSITAVYPNGDVRGVANGTIKTGAPMPSGTAAGRLKTRSYKFVFEKAT